MRLPNGYGTVYKLSGKRRNPWAVKKTVGWDIDPDTGRAVQKSKYVGYYPTKKEAMSALAAYNEDPYDLKANKITFEEVYEKWSDQHFEEIVPSAVRTWISAFNHSKPLHKMRMKDIRVIHLEECIRNADVGSSTKQRMKSLYNLMYRYAMKHEIVDKNYAALCNTVKAGPAVIERIPFSPEEVQTLWDNIDTPFVDMVLIGIYSGWRPQELATLKLADVDPEQRTYFGGMKTDAGKNRIVPVHSKVYDLVIKNYEKALALDSKFLFNDENGRDGCRITYDMYRRRFEKVCIRFDMKHRPHDTRHTFITLGKEYEMDEYILKLIVGHAIDDVTEKVYTHRTIDRLRTEIEKIK